MLKAKQGEANAIANLSKRCLSNTAFFFDIPRPKEESAVELEKKIEKSINLLSILSHSNNYIYFDMYDIPLDRRCTNDVHPLVYLEGKLLSANINFIPVFGFDRDEDYFDAIANLEIIKESGFDDVQPNKTFYLKCNSFCHPCFLVCWPSVEYRPL